METEITREKEESTEIPLQVGWSSCRVTQRSSHPGTHSVVSIHPSSLYVRTGVSDPEDDTTEESLTRFEGRKLYGVCAP